MNKTVRYAAGDWYLVARERGFALLPESVPVTLLESVWETLEAGGLAAVIDALTGAYGMSLSAIPPFAVAIDETEDLRLAVRGGVRVAYDDGTHQDLITGGLVQTWVERAIPSYATLVVTPPDARIEETMLPIASGVVRTGLVTVGDGDVLRPDEFGRRRRRRPEPEGAIAAEEILDADDADDADERADAASAAPLAGVVAAAPQTADANLVLAGDAAGDSVQAPAVEMAEDEAAVDGAADEEAVAAETAEAESAAEAAEPEAAEDAGDVPQEDAAEDAAAEEASADASADDVQAKDAAEEADEAPDAVSDDAEASAGDGRSEEDEAAADASGEAGAEIEAAAESGAAGDDEPSSGDRAVTDELSRDAVNAEFEAIAERELSGDGGDHDGLTLDHIAAGAAIHDEARMSFHGRAVLSTGRVLTLDRVLVVGRRPRVTRSTNGVVPALVSVASPTHDISRNHIEIRREGESVLVTDLNTTNGTVLLRENADPQRLHPGEATLIIAGDIIDIGDEVTVSFEDIP